MTKVPYDKFEIEMACDRLAKFFEAQLPETGDVLGSPENVARFASECRRLAKVIKDDDFDFDRDSVIARFPRILADSFGMSDKHPIMGPFHQLVGPIMCYLGMWPDDAAAPPIPPYPLPGEP